LAKWPVSSRPVANRPTTLTEGGDADVAEAVAPAAIMATLARLTGIDHGHRQALPFERVCLFRLNIHLADEAKFLPAHGNNVHLGGAIGMGLAT